jgi:two-component system, cell cycle response regulator
VQGDDKNVNTILLVDDEAVSRKLFRTALKDGRYAFIDAQGGQEALSILRSKKIDLIVLDIMMPGMSGFEVLDRINENPAFKNIPVIVASSLNDFSSVEKALAAGAQDYVYKPFKQKEARIQFFLKVRNLLTMKNVIDFLELNLKNAQMLTSLDDVTSLFNYRYFKERLHAEFARSQRYHRPLSLIMIDLDNLKAINDEFGHPAGTLVISMIGSIIEKQCRATDIPVRYGGDEFCIIVPETNLAEAVVLAERLRSQIECFGDALDFDGTSITASIGIVTQQYADLLQHDETFLKAADDACYEAKKAGKNQVYCYIDGDFVPAKGFVNPDAAAFSD